MGKFKKFLVIIFGVIIPCFSDGLPGEYLISDQWRTFFSLYSPLTNPAFMMERSYTGLRAVASMASDEASKLWEIGAVMPVGYYHSAGVTVIGENGRDVTSLGDGYFEGRSDTSISSNDNYYIMLSYATNPVGRLNIGANFNIASQGNFGDPSFGVGFDLGLAYRLLYHPVLGYHLIGVMFHNLIAPKLTQFENMSYSPKVKFMYHGSILEKMVEYEIHYDMSDIWAKAENFVKSRKMEWDFFFNCGVRPLPFFAIKAFGNVGDTRKIEYWGLAGEVPLPYLNGGRDFSVLYQFRDEISKGVRGSHSLYVRFDLGRNREEVHARRVARMVNLDASDLYNKAMRLYWKEKYWDAFFIFTRILVEYPDFYRNDVITYHSGSCLEELDMRGKALEVYNNMGRNYSLSSYIPNTDLGKMRIFYRQNKHEDVENMFSELNKPNVPDSIRYHGCYLMGQTEMKRKNFSRALMYFDRIPEEHHDYVFAQHGAAVSHACLNSGTQLISIRLKNCIGAQVSERDQKEIQNRSLVLMGYIFYEENALSNAVSALRMVPPESYYYEDALLGIAWTALKARQWNDCVTAGVKLAQTSSRFVMHCESALLQAYGNMRLKKYEQAFMMLDPIYEKLKNYSGLDMDSLELEDMRYESDRIAYEFLAENVQKIAQRGSSVKQSDVDSLHNAQIRSKRKIDIHFRFRDEYLRTGFFERKIDDLRSDIEYAVAIIQKLLNAPQMNKIREKMIQEESKINSEIEKLREELDSLDSQSE